MLAVHRERVPGPPALCRGSTRLCPRRHVRNGAVIARCSQPEISWWGWRNADDEYLVTSIAKACALNPGARASGAAPHAGSSDSSEPCDADFGETAPASPPKWGSSSVLPAPQSGCQGCPRARFYPSVQLENLGPIVPWLWCVGDSLGSLTVALWWWEGGRCQELSPCVSLQTRP